MAYTVTIKFRIYVLNYKFSFVELETPEYM